MSIHTSKAQEKARSLGGYAGDPDVDDLWDMPKRELIEIALRLGEQAVGVEGVDFGANAVREEARVLRANKII